MTESIDLSYQTALFERRTGVPVDDDGKGFLYSNIAETIKSVIYVSNQIAKRSRRKILRCSDLVLGYENCGFQGALPFPTESRIRMSRDNFQNVDHTILERELNVVSIPNSISPLLTEAPTKDYNVSFQWRRTYMNRSATPEEEITLNSRFIDYCSTAFMEGREEKIQSILRFFKESPKVTSVLDSFFPFIRDEVLNILKEKSIDHLPYLNKLMHCIVCITENTTINCILYDHLYLPSLFSVLASHFDDDLSFKHSAESRNEAAKAISNTYLKSVQMNGTSHEMIKETVFSILSNDHLKVESVYGCIHCILLTGILLIQPFIDSLFLTCLHDSSTFKEYYKESAIRNDMLDLLRVYMNNNAGSDKQSALEQQIQSLCFVSV